MKNTAILLCSVPLLLACGCTSSFAKARAAINEAPEWYAERRTEIRGEGYPKLDEIPVVDPEWKPGGVRYALVRGSSCRVRPPSGVGA